MIRIKKIIITLAIIALFSFTTFQTMSEETKISVICTNSILADFTSNILTNNVTIEYIMPAGICPVYFDTCPSDIELISKADIIISFGNEPWLQSLLISSGNTNIKQIICGDIGEWNIPSGAIKYVNKIKNELQKLYPEYNNSIKENTQIYLSEINETADNLKNIILKNNSNGKKVICMQWQKEFIEWLGLNVTYTYAPPESLSLQDELDVINAASKDDIHAIIDNLQSGTDFGARVASESGKSHIILTNFPYAIPGTDTYIEMITYNTKQLIKGIDNYEFKYGEIQKLENQINELEIQRNITIAISIIFVTLTSVFFIMYKKRGE
jgi:ABC-type Zn uptake system ZnuABC Zn-binding protein ZnuA